MADDGEEPMDVSAAAAEEVASKPLDAPKPTKKSTHELPWYAVNSCSPQEIVYSRILPYTKDREIPADQAAGGGGERGHH